MIDSLLAFTIATALLAISPGPDNIYVLTQSIANGTKSGLATTAGLISGCIVHTTLIAFGVSTIITSSPTLFWIIKIAGATYLFFLAYKVFTSDTQITLDDGVPRKSYSALFKQGFLMNILNPKVTLFFLALFPGFLWKPEGNTVAQFYILGLVFMLISLLIFASIAIISGKISKLLQSSNASNGILKWLQIIVFIAIAIFILLP